jgi:hypothetical protein
MTLAMVKVLPEPVTPSRVIDQAELQQRVAELEARLAELEPAEAEDAGEEKAAA